MSPDPFFWYALVLKVAMTATIVVVVSVAAERSGPFIAALIAALPTAASATYIILAVEHPPAFVAAAAIGSMAANAAVAIFAFTYTALAQRHGIVLSIAVATLLWFAIAAALRLVEWTSATALVLNAIVFAFTIPLSARYRDAAVPRDAVKRTRYDLPLRAAAALVAAAVTTASHWIGSFASGVFAVFPIVLATFVVIMHPRSRDIGILFRYRPACVDGENTPCRLHDLRLDMCPCKPGRVSKSLFSLWAGLSIERIDHERQDVTACDHEPASPRPPSRFR
jgi:uncharacterized membrane protein (GlpM family)